jgi:hypothetical protein
MIPRSCIVGLLINERRLSTSPNTALRMRALSARIKIIPINVRIVMSRDFIHPRALQRVAKKKNQSMSPTTIAVTGFKKNDATQIDTRAIAPARRVFMILFQRETTSSFLSAKNTNIKLNTVRKASTTRVQNAIFSPVSLAV